MQGASVQFRQETGISDPFPNETTLILHAGVPDPIAMKGADQLAQPAAAALRLRVLPVFEIPDALFGHPILRFMKKAVVPSISMRGPVVCQRESPLLILLISALRSFKDLVK